MGLDMGYDEVVAELTQKIAGLDYVQDFQKSEQLLQQESALFEMQEEMKKLQKEATLYRKIGKMQAYKETAHEAQKLEKSIKHHPLTETYVAKLADVTDLIQHITSEIEQKVNDLLESSD